MLRIYLPSSMDLKLCSDVPIVNFIDTKTFATLHSGPSSWVQKFESQYSGHVIWVPSVGVNMRHNSGPGYWVPRSKDPLRAFAPKMTVIILVTIGRRGAVSFKKIVLCSELKLYWISISNLLTRELSSSTKSKSKYRQTHLVTNMCVIPKENSLKFYYSKIAYLVICLIKSQFRVVFI